MFSSFNHNDSAMIYDKIVRQKENNNCLKLENVDTTPIIRLEEIEKNGSHCFKFLKIDA